ncbi:hypothetical protein AAFP35_01565 [Gordonia sp. CPCC 206044]|uniref:hypothetical protein n=1 Tax=Gordonia sp. CPCC 206044 TaxID=3140793 RepID=UPI003AF3850A
MSTPQGTTMAEPQTSDPSEQRIDEHAPTEPITPQPVAETGNGVTDKVRNAVIAGGIGIAVVFALIGFGVGYVVGDSGSSSDQGPGMNMQGGGMGPGGAMGSGGQGGMGQMPMPGGQGGMGQMPMPGGQGGMGQMPMPGQGGTGQVPDQQGQMPGQQGQVPGQQGQTQQNPGQTAAPQGSAGA